MTTPEPTPAGGDQHVGFFAALFDLDFKHFVALRFIRVIYVIAIVFIGIGALAAFAVALSQGEVLTALVALAFLFFYLIVIRVWLEVIALLFRIGENTSDILRQVANR